MLQVLTSPLREKYNEISEASKIALCKNSVYFQAFQCTVLLISVINI